MKGAYSEICNFPEQLLVVFIDRQVRVIFDDGADIGRRRFRKRNGLPRTRGAACWSYCPRVIIGILSFLLRGRFVKGCAAISVIRTSGIPPPRSSTTLQFCQ